MYRSSTSAWLLDHTAYDVIRSLWQVDPKDVYITVEEVINQELSKLVNEVMFDESLGN